MKKLVLLPALIAGITLGACGTDDKPLILQAPPAEQQDGEDENTTQPDMNTNKISIKAGNATFTATLADNSSARALQELLADGDLTLDLSDYGKMEKVGPLGRSLPCNDEEITTQPGDLILYLGSNFSIYYAPNTWSFTRLGHIDGATRENLLAALGDGDVSVTLSLD